MQKQAVLPSANLEETKEENEANWSKKNAAKVSKMKVNELLRSSHPTGSKTNGTNQTEKRLNMVERQERKEKKKESHRNCCILSF